VYDLFIYLVMIVPFIHLFGSVWLSNFLGSYGYGPPQVAFPS